MPMPTSRQPTTVSADMRLVHQANQTGGRTRRRGHAGALDALLDFAKQPPSPGTSQLLGRFEAIQESLAQRNNAQALADMPSSSMQRPPAFGTTALMFQGMPSCMDVASASPIDEGAWVCMPSSSVQQSHLPETRMANEQSTSAAVGSGSGAGFRSRPTEIARQKVDAQTLRALNAALAHDPGLDVAAWARANHFHARTIRNYVYKGALTPEAWNRLELADGKASRLRRVEVDDLRALRDALADNPGLDVAAWARARGLNAMTVKRYVAYGALAPDLQDRLELADGKASRLRKMEVDDLRALRDALTLNPALNVTEWALANHFHTRTTRNLVCKGALKPEVQRRLDRADGKARRCGPLSVDDLRELRDALALDSGLNVAEWARGKHLHPRSIEGYVSKGVLTLEARDRLDVADGKTPRFRKVGIEDLRALDAALGLDRRLNVSAWARTHSLHASTVRAFVRNGALTPAAREMLRNDDGQAAKPGTDAGRRSSSET
ncbi:hypothetical protein [Pandoraea pulmonicola]|nr:hypothetical protein [Pandoraea pulmonicola]